MTDLNLDNGWIKEQATSEVIRRADQTSAVAQVARKVQMTSEFASVPRFAANGVDVVAEGANIPVRDFTPDEVTLRAIKFANRFQISVEDSRDAIADAVNNIKLEWASNFAVKLDNACLGTTAAANGGTVPFQSVYNAVGAGARTATAGNLTYEDVVGAFDALLSGKYPGDLVVIAHPSFQMQLRNLKDEAGDRVASDPLAGGTPTLFGHTVVYSNGARTSATATDEPAGNPLLIVGSRKNLILGVRDGVESGLSDQPGWENDMLDLKLRARRGFVVADATAFRVIEKTAAA